MDDGFLLFEGIAAMLSDWRKTLDRLAMRAGWTRGEVRSKALLQTSWAARAGDNRGGAPASPFTVSRELRHGSRSMVEAVYAHLGTICHRSEAVEYRSSSMRRCSPIGSSGLRL
jgi:hypothetical protein